MPRSATETTTKAATKKANTKTAKEPKAKSKRAPSAYNLFMGEHLKAWRADHPGTQVKEAMSAVAAMWRDAPENPNRGKEPAAKKPKAAKPAAKKTKKAEKSDASEEEAADDDEE